MGISGSHDHGSCDSALDNRSSAPHSDLEEFTRCHEWNSLIGAKEIEKVSFGREGKRRKFARPDPAPHSLPYFGATINSCSRTKYGESICPG